MTLDEIAAWLQLPATAAIPLTGVSIDSRTIQPGHLFVAIKGSNFDGHDFIENACQKGAVAALCSRPVEKLSIPQLIMPCTLDALALIATCHRKRLGCEVIALTGSNGKTTVKEMIATLLPKPALGGSYLGKLAIFSSDEPAHFDLFAEDAVTFSIKNMYSIGLSQPNADPLQEEYIVNIPTDCKLYQPFWFKIVLR